MNYIYIPTACLLRFHLDLLKGTLVWKYNSLHLRVELLLDFKQMKKEYSAEDSYYLQINGHLS